MHFLQKIKDSPHYERLKKSAQYRFDRRQFLGMAAITFGYILLTLLSTSSGIKRDLSNAIAVIFSLAFLGATLYFGYRWLEIFLCMEHYIFCHVKMDNIHLRGRGYACFTVEFTDRQGKTQTRDTDNMFSSYREPYAETYNHQMALVAYNEKTDRLVVIGQVNG